MSSNGSFDLFDKISGMNSEIKRELLISLVIGLIPMKFLGKNLLSLYYIRKVRAKVAGEHVSGIFIISFAITCYILKLMQMDSPNYLVNEESLGSENTKTTIIFLIASICSFMITVLVNYILGVPKLKLTIPHNSSFMGVLTYHIRFLIPNIVVWLVLAIRYFKVNKIKYNIAIAKKQI